MLAPSLWGVFCRAHFTSYNKVDPGLAPAHGPHAGFCALRSSWPRLLCLRSFFRGSTPPDYDAQPAVALLLHVLHMYAVFCCKLAGLAVVVLRVWRPRFENSLPTPNRASQPCPSSRAAHLCPPVSRSCLCIVECSRIFAQLVGCMSGTAGTNFTKNIY